jgi:hypothetical protein
LANFAAYLQITKYILLNFFSYNNTISITDSANKVTIQQKLNLLKNKTDTLLTIFAQTHQIYSGKSVLLGGSLINAQLSLSDSDEETSNTAIENKISIVLPLNCTDILKAYYHIPESTSLTFLKTVYDSNMNLDNLNDSYISEMVNFRIFNPDTLEVLDTEVCKNSMLIKTFTKAVESLNMTKYKDYKASNIDVYNANDPAFNDICVTHIDTESGFDTTINWRRGRYYDNYSAICEGANCTYIGIDELNYVNCNCKYIRQEQSITSNFKAYLLGQITVWNFGVFLCMKDIAEVTTTY